MPEEEQILEQGSIYFTYRPAVDTHDPDGLEDVARFHMILVPRGKTLYRLAVIGRKRLPDIDKHERNWGFIEAVKESPREVAEALQEQQAETETRGERTYPANRPAGEGVYIFYQRDRTMRLVYALTQPEKPGPVQEALNIPTEGSFAVSIKNPEAGQPRDAGLSEEQKAAYPQEKQDEFEGRRFAPTPRLGGCRVHLDRNTRGPGRSLRRGHRGEGGGDERRTDLPRTPHGKVAPPRRAAVRGGVGVK